MALSWVRLVVCATVSAALLTASLHAEDTYSYAGTVTNSVTGEPIQRAMVRMTCWPQRVETAGPPVSRPMMPTTRSVFTDTGGTFRIEALKAGRCSVQAEKPGFTSDEQLWHSVELTASVTDASVHLAPLSVISGTVTDAEGVPQRGVNVFTYRSLIRDGKRELVRDRQVSTDDRGVYRLWNLRPGKYYVKAAGMAGGTANWSTDLPAVSLELEGFAPVYFGGGNSLQTANPIEIKPGSQERADIAVRLERSRTVRGQLGGFVEGEAVQFELLQGDEDSGVRRSSLNRYNGAFQIYDVVPGAYRLRAVQGKSAAGEVNIVVGDRDLTGVLVPLTAAVDVRFAFTAENPPDVSTMQVPEGAHSEGRAFRGPLCWPLLTRDSGAAERATTYHPDNGEDPASSLLFRGVLPGRYRIAIQCGESYLTAMTQGDADLLATRTLTIAGGTPPVNVEVRVRHGGGTISGTWKIDGERGAPSVLLVPPPNSASEVQTAGLGMSQRDNATTAIFSFGQLTPGTYTLYAFRSLADVEYRNADFLRSLTGGVQVTVEDGKTTTAEITRFAQ